MHFVISLKNLSPYSPSWNTESLLVPWALAWLSEAGDGSVGRSGWLQLFLWFEAWLWGNIKSPVSRWQAARDPPCAMWIMIHGSCVEVKSWVIGSPTTGESSGGCCEFEESLAMPLGWSRSSTMRELQDKAELFPQLKRGEGCWLTCGFLSLDLTRWFHIYSFCLPCYLF